MRSLLDHACLVTATAALLACGLRLATRAGAAGTVRVLAAVVLAASLAAVELLLLGLVRLGDERIVVLAVAVLTWFLVRRLLTVPDRPGVFYELAAWWRESGSAGRAAAGAGVVLTLAWVTWQLRYPYLGIDGVTYHLPLAGEFATGGRAGALVPVLDGLPVENYPVTNEVLLAWALGLGGSWAVVSVWTVLLAGVLLLGGRTALAELAVPGRTAGLGLTALLLLPIAITQLGAPLTDVTALAWLAAAAGLALAARRNPLLLGPALLAAGLSFGTKTTGSLALLAALGGVAWTVRTKLPRLARPLGLAAVAAVVVGGVWALRNTVLHGSPLWPLVATSFGDPVPATLAPLDASFLSHPREMLTGRLDDYAQGLAGGLLLLGGGLLAGVLGRSRACWLASALVAVMALAWGLAPYTGITTDDALAVGAVRYLLPCLAVCVAALGVAARDGGRRVRRGIDAGLALAALLSLGRALQLGFPLIPGAGTIVVAVLLGVGFTLALGRSGLRLPAAPAVRTGLAGGLALLLVALLTVGGRGYVDRHRTAGIGDQELLGAALARPEFADGSFPVAMGPAVNALLAGDHLRHDVSLLGEQSSCADVRERRRTGWVVLQRLPATAQYQRLVACLGGEPPVWSDPVYELHAG